MNRRSLLKYATMLGLGQLAPETLAIAQSPAKSGHGPIVLYCDLAFAPAQEQEMLDRYHKEFKPAAEKFDGYIDLKMVKFRKVMQGGPPPPQGVNYRFQLTYESEEKRQKWIASPTHKRVWPRIEELVLNRDYIVLLTDSM